MSDEQVWVISRRNGGREKVYHTDPECPHIDDARSIRHVRTDVLFDDRRECAWCRDDHNSGRQRGASPAESARAGPDDVPDCPDCDNDVFVHAAKVAVADYRCGLCGALIDD